MFIFLVSPFLLFLCCIGYKKRGIYVYLRFLYSAVVSLMLLMSVYPFSMALCSSSMFFVTRLTYCPLSYVCVRACFMYLSVIVDVLCPSRSLT